MNKQQWGIFAVAGGFITFVLEIVSLATVGWLSLGGANYGLWKACTPLACASITGPSYFLAVRAFMMIGCLVLAMGLAASIMTALGKGPDLLPKIAISAYSAAALSILIAMAIYTAEFNTAANFFGYSFYLGWVSFVLSLLLSIVLSVASRAMN